MSPASSQSLPLGVVTVESSVFAKVAYDNQRASLQVTFHNGAMYQYLGVPVDIYEALLQADSKGGYFNHHVRNSFPHTLLRAADATPSG